MTEMTEDQKDQIRHKAEWVCGEPVCNHRSAQGYIYCNCCLHGRCNRASDEAIEAKATVAAGFPDSLPFTLNAPQLDDLCETAGRVVGAGFDAELDYEDFLRYMDASVEQFRMQVSMAHSYMEEERNEFDAAVDRGIAKANARIPDVICRMCDAVSPGGWSAMDDTLCGPCYNGQPGYDTDQGEDIC